MGGGPCRPKLPMLGGGEGERVLALESREGTRAPDTPGSPEGNTEGPGTASSEPLLPS